MRQPVQIPCRSSFCLVDGNTYHEIPVPDIVHIPEPFRQDLAAVPAQHIAERPTLCHEIPLPQFLNVRIAVIVYLVSVPSDEIPQTVTTGWLHYAFYLFFG